MISYNRGNILNTHAQALLIPVNCLKIFGAGLAKQAIEHKVFSQRIDVHRDRIKWQPGKLYDITGDEHLPHIYAATTKDHWKDPSRREWVAAIVEELATWDDLGYQRVAVPRLGCGLGGLDYEADLLPLVMKHLDAPKTQFLIYI